MITEKLKKFIFNGCLLISMSVAAAPLHAKKIVISGDHDAGFIIAADKNASEPVIHYQQNIEMLAGMNDRVSISIFGNGRVLVHYPVYMKRAGDYEMQLDETELLDLIQELSGNGVMDFDEQKVRGKVQTYKKALREKGEFYEISDAVETVVDIQLDEYQKNNKSKKLKKFHKKFAWKNLEQDASRYAHDTEITKANNSVTHFKALMKDNRLIKREKQ